MLADSFDLLLPLWQHGPAWHEQESRRKGHRAQGRQGAAHSNVSRFSIAEQKQEKSGWS
jgi:hypothetical protein